VANNQQVEAGQPIFQLDTMERAAALAAAKSGVAEVEAAMSVAQTELVAAVGSVTQARAALKQSEEELSRNLILRDRGSAAVAEREVDRLLNLVDVRQGAVDAALANQASVQAKIDTLLPAQKAQAEAQQAQVQREFDRLTVLALGLGLDLSGDESEFEVYRRWAMIKEKAAAPRP
jgi:multidrug resistance efflux pump